jgi:hypothetical protein
MSVDGTHCPIEDPRPFSKKWSSHKLGGKPSVIYEIDHNINQSKVIWVSAPFPPGQFNNLQDFSQGLKDKIPVGKQSIADDGYKGEAECISTKNKFDPREIAWHETLNKRIKIFNCLTPKFCNCVTMHKVVFGAVCVITIYKMENGCLLFDLYPFRI